MNRTSVGYLEKPLKLLFGQISSEGDLRLNSAHDPGSGLALDAHFRLDSGVGQVYVYFLKWPLFPFCVHSNCDAHACPQRREEQFMGVRSSVISARVARFIGMESMRADGYILNKIR